MGKLTEQMKSAFAEKLRTVAMDALEAFKQKSLEQHDKERHGGHYDGGPCSFREKMGIKTTPKKGGGDNQPEPANVKTEPPNKDGEDNLTKGGVDFGKFLEAKMSELAPETQEALKNEKVKADLEKLANGFGEEWKKLYAQKHEEKKNPPPAEEWKPRDKSGDKIAEDGTIMKNGVALDPTFQEGGTKSKYRQMRNKWVKELLSADDGTFDLETGKPIEFDKGFQVAFQEQGGMTDDEYDKIVEEITVETGAKPNLGCFEVPEISFHFDDRATAIKMMEKYNQHSLWNWGKCRILMNKKLDKTTNDVKQGAIAKGKTTEKGE